MKKNRYIPFGYTMRNGKLVIEQNEANVIRNIYEDYVNGATLKEIAERLTHAGVPYSEKRSDCLIPWKMTERMTKPNPGCRRISSPRFPKVSPTKRKWPGSLTRSLPNRTPDSIRRQRTRPRS